MTAGINGGRRDLRLLAGGAQELPLEEVIELEPDLLCPRIAQELLVRDQPRLLAGAVTLHDALEPATLNVHRGNQHANTVGDLCVVLLDTVVEARRALAILFPGLAKDGVNPG